MAYFGRNSLLSAAFGTILWPKLTYFGRKKVISAEIRSFGCFRLSAEIADFETPSFGFGRNSFGWPLHFITLELPPYDNYRPETIFWPCPEVVTISDNYCTGRLQWHPGYRDSFVISQTITNKNHLLTVTTRLERQPIVTLPSPCLQGDGLVMVGWLTIKRGWRLLIFCLC